jgi:GxxExxY protein
MALLHENTTKLVLQSFYKVYNTLGFGFLEKVYENALLMELAKTGLFCEQQKLIEVYYEGTVVGKYFADIVVNNCLIIELKAAEGLCLEHECQLINYLKATNIEVGLLLNFGRKPEFRRKIFENTYKPSSQDEYK